MSMESQMKFLSFKTFLEEMEMGTCSKTYKNQPNNNKKIYKKCHNSISRSPKIPNWFEYTFFYNLFKAEIITLAAKLKALALTCMQWLTELDSDDINVIVCVLWESRAPREPLHVFTRLFFIIPKQVSIYFSCSGECCGTVLWPHLTYHQHRIGGEQIMSLISFLVKVPCSM